MAKNVRKLFAMLLTVCMVMSLLSVTAFAEQASTSEDLIDFGPLSDRTYKTDERLAGEDNRYEVKLSVTGAGTVDQSYSEVIIMLDNSASNSSSFGDFKQMLRDVGENVLTDKGNVRLTLMTFGVSGSKVFSVSSMEDLEAQVRGMQNYGELVLSVPNTNCEAGVAAVEDLINNSPNLKEAYVIYASDAASNMDEVEFAWENWKDAATEDNYNNLRTTTGSRRATVQEIIDVAMDFECGYYVDGGYLSEPTKVIFADVIEAVETASEAAISSAQAALETAEGELEAIEVLTAPYEAAIETAEGAKTEGQTELNAAKAPILEAEAAVQAAQNIIDSDTATEEEKAQAQIDKVEAEAALDAAKNDATVTAAIQAAESKINAAQNEIDAAQAALNATDSENPVSLAAQKSAAEAAVESAETALNTAQSSKRTNLADALIEAAKAPALDQDGNPIVDREGNVTVITTNTYDMPGSYEYTRGVQWIDYGWQYAYENYGLTYGQDVPYSIGTVEKAFIAMDPNHVNGSIVGSWVGPACYYATYMYRNRYVDMHTYNEYNAETNSWERTIPGTSPYMGNNAAARMTSLATNEKVQNVFMVGYGGRANGSWMNPASKGVTSNEAVTGTNVSYHHSTSLTDMYDVLRGISAEINAMPYKDVSISDYMSKWVNLDLNQPIRILKGNDVICEYVYDAETGTGSYTWLCDPDEIPTAKDPIILEKVDSADYVNGGDAVIGNSNGDIYKITWNVKDGYLEYTDTYFLTYQVTVDTGESGFVYDNNYPANGTTSVNYIDESGETQTEEVDVPQVKVPNPNPGNPGNGGGGGGGTIVIPTTPPVDLEEPEVPLGQLPEEELEIPEEDVPLTELPEEDVPLAMAPATGDASVIWMALSALSGAGLFLTRKKREDEE